MSLKGAFLYIFQVIYEELWWRIICASLIAWLWYPIAALIISSLGFGFGHWYKYKDFIKKLLGFTPPLLGPGFTWQMIVACIPLGLLLGGLYLFGSLNWLGNIVTCVILHWIIGYLAYECNIIQKWIKE